MGIAPNPITTNVVVKKGVVIPSRAPLGMSILIIHMISSVMVGLAMIQTETHVVEQWLFAATSMETCLLGGH
jgi:hypothetical protein